MRYPNYDQILSLLPEPRSFPKSEAFEFKLLKSEVPVEEALVIFAEPSMWRITFPMGQSLRGRIWLKRVWNLIDSEDQKDIATITQTLYELTGLPLIVTGSMRTAQLILKGKA